MSFADFPPNQTQRSPRIPQPANYVLAGPASGAKGPPSYRLLVAADIPGGSGPSYPSPTLHAIPVVSNATGPVLSNSSITDNGTTVTVGEYLSTPWGSGTSYNVRLGANAGNGTATGDTNVAIGSSSLGGLTSGSNNVGLGFGTLAACTTGGQNMAIGLDSMEGLTTGSYNTGVGEYTLKALTTGYGNIAIGSSALQYLVYGIYNACVGFGSGASLTAYESYNTLLGYLADNRGSNDSYGVALGSYAKCGSNELAISPYVTVQTWYGNTSVQSRPMMDLTYSFPVSTDASYTTLASLRAWDWNASPYTVFSWGGNGSAAVCSFFGATPVVKRSGDVATGLVALGLFSSASYSGAIPQATFSTLG